MPETSPKADKAPLPEVSAEGVEEAIAEAVENVRTARSLREESSLGNMRAANQRTDTALTIARTLDRVLPRQDSITWHQEISNRSYVEDGEKLTPFNHPALAHYTPEQIVNGDIESGDLDLIRDLEHPDTRPELM